MDQLKVESRPGIHEGIRILQLSGPFTLVGVFEFNSKFRNDSTPVTIVDLTEVPYIDSAALGALVGVHTSSQRHARHYALVGVSERIRSLFGMAGVEGVLLTSPTLAEAQQKFARAAAH